MDHFLSVKYYILPPDGNNGSKMKDIWQSALLWLTSQWTSVQSDSNRELLIHYNAIT